MTVTKIEIAPDIIEAMQVGQRVLAMFIDPAAIEQTTTLTAYAQAVEAEAKLRAALRRARMLIKTERLPNGEWFAIDDNTYDGPGSKHGLGDTEQEAIQDLIDQLEDVA